MRTSLATGIAVGLLVTILGGLAGWYAYLRSHASDIRAADTARGFAVGNTFLGLGGGSDSGSGSVLGSNPGVSVSSLGMGGLSGSGDAMNGQDSAADGGADGASAREATSTPPKTPRLWHAVSTPVAGFGFTKNGGVTEVRYVERATGYIFSVDPWSGEASRLANTLNAKTQDAIIVGDRIIERDFAQDGVVTRNGSIGRTATSSAYLSEMMSGSIGAIAASTELDALLYTRLSAGGSEAVIARADGSKPQTVFSSSLTQWEPVLVPTHMILAQKPSDGVPGYAYEIGKKGAVSLLLGNLPGLMVLPRASSTALMWSTSGNGMVSLYARTAAAATPTLLSLKTLASKCVWAPTATSGSGLFAYCAVPRSAPPTGFLDAWLQGAYKTDDAWWQIDASAGATQALYADESDIDVRDPQVDPSGRFLAFINGKDSSLWVLRIVK